MRKLSGWIGMAALALALGAAGVRADVQGLGMDLPPPALGSYFTDVSADGVGGIWACDGDALYKAESGTFGEVYSGIAAAGGGLAFDPAGLALTSDGTRAYVASGFSNQLVEIDMSGPTPSARHLPDASIPGSSNFGVAVDPVYGQVFLTDGTTHELYLVDAAGTGSLTLLEDFGGTAAVGGGLAFSPSGELYVPVATTMSNWPDDDEFTVDLYRFSRTWLDDLAAGTVNTGAGQLLVSDFVTSGSSDVAVDSAGITYLVGSDAIYAIDEAGNRMIAAGDPSLNAWDMWGYGFMGLAYDAAEDRVITGYAASSGQQYEATGVTPMPEPGTLALVAAGLGLGLVRKRKRRRTDTK